MTVYKLAMTLRLRVHSANHEWAARELEHTSDSRGRGDDNNVATRVARSTRESLGRPNAAQIHERGLGEVDDQKLAAVRQKPPAPALELLHGRDVDLASDAHDCAATQPAVGDDECRRAGSELGRRARTHAARRPSPERAGWLVSAVIAALGLMLYIVVTACVDDNEARDASSPDRVPPRTGPGR